MTTATTGGEVLEMAMGMERIGKDFYEALALGCDDARVRDFCVTTARDEANHFTAFQRMRDQWAQKAKAGRTPPDAADALATLARDRIQPDPAAVRKVAVGGNLKDAVNMAIQMEQDAILFYQGMLAGLPDCLQVIQGIVEEEKRHLTRLRSLGI